jgi:hypothetical protein
MCSKERQNFFESDVWDEEKDDDVQVGASAMQNNIRSASRYLKAALRYDIPRQTVINVLFHKDVTSTKLLRLSSKRLPDHTEPCIQALY